MYQRKEVSVIFIKEYENSNFIRIQKIIILLQICYYYINQKLQLINNQKHLNLIEKLYFLKRKKHLIVFMNFLIIIMEFFSKK